MVLGIRSFFQSAARHRQKKLPLNDIVTTIWMLESKEDSTVTSVEGFAAILQFIIRAAEIADEWKLFQVDNDLPTYDPKELIEVF